MGRRQLRAADGYAFGIYEALPADEPKGAVVVIQEIFGVNAHIREVADGFAAAGYAALAPALFDRVERDVELGYDGDGMGRGRALAFDGLKQEQALADLQATVEEASKYGPVGVVGYCFGGLMAYLCACRLEGVACVAAYYGGGIAGALQGPAAGSRERAAMSDDHALRRTRRAHPVDGCGTHQRSVAGRAGTRLRRRPRLQLRPSRQLPRRFGGVGAPAHADVAGGALVLTKQHDADTFCGSEALVARCRGGPIAVREMARFPC